MNENVWKLSHEIALLSLNLGMTYIKKKNYDKGEVFILKAKKVTEPPNQAVNWESRLDWQIIRLNIFQNLAIIYKNQKKDEKAYELLKSLVKHLKPENIISQNAEIIISSIDNLYINLANLCYTLQHHDETILYSKIGINFLKSVLKSSDLLSKIEILLMRNKEELGTFVSKKKMLIAYLFHLIGKSEIKQSNPIAALSHFRQAYTISKETQGENDETTINYKKKYINLEEPQANPKLTEENILELSDSMNNSSENPSPAGKKAKFIKDFVQNEENQLFIKRERDDKKQMVFKEKDDIKLRISPIILISPKHQIVKREEFPTKSYDNQKIMFRLDENNYIKKNNEQKNLLDTEDSIRISEIKVMYPTNHLFFGAQKMRKTTKVNSQTKSLSNFSDLNSILWKKSVSNKHEKTHRFNFSQQIPFLENLLMNVNPSSNSSQRNLLYNISNLSTRHSPRLETKPSESFQTVYNFPENEPLIPPKKYMFLISNRPNTTENPLKTEQSEQPSNLKVQHGGESSEKKGTIININKIPSITINSIGDLNDKSTKNRINKTPKSSFSSLKTPKVFKTLSTPNDPSFLLDKEKFPTKSSSLKKNITVRIPQKQLTINSSFHAIKIIKSTNNTPALLENKKNKNTSNSNHFNMTNSVRKFSIPTASLIPHYSIKVSKDDKKESKHEIESPLKKETHTQFPAVEHTFLRRQITLITNEKPIDISEHYIEESIVIEKAVLAIQKEVRKFLRKMRYSMPFSPQKKSLYNRIEKGSNDIGNRTSLLNLKNLQSNENNSNNTSKFSPRREDLLMGTSILETKEPCSADLKKTEESLSSVDSADVENLNFFPIKFLMNMFNKNSYWSLLGFSIKGKSTKRGVDAKFFLKSACFNLNFTWIIPFDSLNKPKNQGNMDYLWSFLNVILEIKLQAENQKEFYLVKNEEIKLRENLLDKFPNDEAFINPGDYEEFVESVSKMKFFLKHFFVLKRKITGKIWIFSSNLQHNNQINFLSRELKDFLSEKKSIIKSIVCQTLNQNLIIPSCRLLKKKMQSLDFDQNENMSKNPEEYSLFSKISSPAISETNYHKNKNLPPKPKQRPSISMSVYDNHIRLIKKPGMTDIEKDEDYRFQTLTQPPVLLTQLKTALSNKEIITNSNRSDHGSRKDSTVKEVSEDIIELSEDSEEHFDQKDSEDQQKDSENQSVMIKKDLISNEYISIENALKSAFYNDRSESGSPLSPLRRLTTSSPIHIRSRGEFMRKSLTNKVDEEQFQEVMESFMKENFSNEKKDATLPKLRLMNSFKRKRKFVRDKLKEAIEEEEKSPGKEWSIQKMNKNENFVIKWNFYKDLKAFPCPKDLFPKKDFKQLTLLIIFIILKEDIQKIVDFIKIIDIEIIDTIKKKMFINLQLIQINSTYKVKYSLGMPFCEFDSNFLENSYNNPNEFLKFFYFKKFDRINLKKFLKNVKKISIENCEITIKQNLKKKKKDSLKCQFIQRIILPENDENIVTNTLVLHDPQIIRMKYYNSIKILNKSAYYEKFNNGIGMIYLRVRFLKVEDIEIARISIYNPFLKQIEYQQIDSQIVFVI